MDGGVWFLLASTILFAVAAILIKAALRTVSILTVMVFKMTLGAALLVVYVAVTGRLGAVTHLTATQWGFVAVTGLILLAFTITVIVGLRHASATGVIAISAGSPIITTLLVVFTRHIQVPTMTLLGLGLVFVAVLLIYAFGRRQEVQAWQQAQPAAVHERTALT
jgi:drug/metabolite transporter (DMT)-like permease